MTRFSAIALLASLAVFLGVPGVAWVAGVEGGGSTLENKALGKRPELTAKNMWDASWGSAFSDWTWDNIPLRDVFLRADHALDTKLFRDSPVPKSVIFGINDGPQRFAYTRERVFGGRAGGVDVKRLLAVIGRVNGAFVKEKVPFVMVVSPNKATMYPEYLSPRHREANEKSVKPVVDALEAYGPPVVNLWAVLREEKARLLNATDLPSPRLRYLYRPYDDHWSLETGRIQAREIVKAIDASAWDERVLPRITGYELGESEMSKIYLKTGEQEPYGKIEESALVDLKQRKVPVAKGQSITVFESRPTETFTPKQMKVVVIRDSFLAAAPLKPSAASDAGHETIARFFTTSVFIHWDTLALHPDKALEQLADADVVVLQVTQGNLTNVIRHEKKLVDVARAVHNPPAKKKRAAPMLGTPKVRGAQLPMPKSVRDEGDDDGAEGEGDDGDSAAHPRGAPDVGPQ